MKTLNLILSSFIILLVTTSSGTYHPRIFIAGDSTAQGYDTTKTVMRGWGQMLPYYICDGTEVVNHAKAGRSTKSFRNEGRWDSLISQVQKGDWVLIQFSHNDTSTKPERHASPEDFRENLIRFIEEVHAKEANPMLLTPLVMRTFHEGNLIDNRLKTYPGIIRKVAQEYNIPIIDVNLKTRDLILLLGDEKSKELYVPNDDTHTCEAGARAVAEFVVEGLKEYGVLTNCSGM
ncbi:rhamnogalacturonan acetylesterase [Bacteroides sp. 51]|uniref:rhamnogalacturonan acetylesterase n=1 Tax=Bacteroides sp. 51 TaxID=2302938 RepID=UPI0013D273DB|nr:rhamnogalacturonan acetylesterase [Bacteroides sp. 51]NDV82157.1 rhamnogalacturonan acetylesterase [Bacteroides sp. 51]